MAVLRHSVANLGIVIGWGGTQSLPRLIGEAKARGMFLTVKRVKADEAFRIGLVGKICADLNEFIRRS